MAKVQRKYEKPTPWHGIFAIINQFALLSPLYIIYFSFSFIIYNV